MSALLVVLATLAYVLTFHNLVVWTWIALFPLPYAGDDLDTAITHSEYATKVRLWGMVLWTLSFTALAFGHELWRYELR